MALNTTSTKFKSLYIGKIKEFKVKSYELYESDFEEFSRYIVLSPDGTISDPSADQTTYESFNDFDLKTTAEFYVILFRI